MRFRKFNCFDLFPQTYHIETLVRFTKSDMRIPAVAIAVAFFGAAILLGRGLHLSHGVLGIFLP